MSRKPLLWKLFPAYFLIALLSVVMVALYASQALRDFYHDQVERDLAIRAEMVRQDIEQIIPDAAAQDFEDRIIALGKSSHTRLTVIGTHGLVLADSERNPAKMENHADRPEFIQAARGKMGTARRVSPTLGYTMVYVALPIRSHGKVTAVLRTSMAATALDAAPSVVYNRILTGAVLIGLFAVIASMLAVRAVSKPLRRLKQAAEQFGHGNFKSKVPTSDTEEFASLGDTLNRMAAQLDHQVRTITRQASEQQAILSSMMEAVVAIDNDQRILILNPAAEQLLGTSLSSAKGKAIQEVVRNPILQRFFERINCADIPIADEITLRGADERIVQAAGSPLMGPDNKQIGVLMVLNDITQTRKLESMRKDFVANVSHELKTPITSIKGFVEALRDGALDDPDQSREFLDIIARQADRLHAIIDDLLALSSIEQKAGTAEIALEASPICEVLKAAAVCCKPSASESGSELTIDCPDGLIATINAPLLEQAITNLLDNAIKYSSGGIVSISAAQEADEIAISVTDTGQGIEAEHLPRLFERFYRVDKARSRKQGGTGLGLAIVKHIVQAHHGQITVQSTPGKGSTFTIHLPAA